MPVITVEEALRNVECSAGALRFALESGASAAQPPDGSALNGLAEIAEQTEHQIHQIHAVLPSPVLAAPATRQGRA